MPAAFAFHFVLLVVPGRRSWGYRYRCCRAASCARSARPAAAVVSRLYAANTLGAAAGAAIGGWFLLGNLGFDGTVRLASTLNILAAAAVLLLGRGAHERDAPAASAPPSGDPARSARRAYLAVACTVRGDGCRGARARGRLLPARRRHHALEFLHVRPRAHAVSHPIRRRRGGRRRAGSPLSRNPTRPSSGSNSGSAQPACSGSCYC